jgi:PPOX class probable F420-dependent enzyme
MLSGPSRLIETLDAALIGLLTTVNRDGQPQTSPVWFHRSGDDVIVYSRPNTPKLENVAVNPLVGLSLRGDRQGHAGVSLEGSAVIDVATPRSNKLAGYVGKYAEEISDLGWTPESFADDYSVCLRISVTKVRSFGLSKWDETAAG